MLAALRVLKKFSTILDGQQKKKAAVLAVMMVFGGFLEMLSISLVLPFMEAVTGAGGAAGEFAVRLISGLFGVQEKRTVMITMAVLLAVIYILKNLYLLLEHYLQARFVYATQFQVQKRIVHSYLSRRYDYFLGVDFGEVYRVTDGDAREAFQLLLAILHMITEVVIAVTLIVTAFVIAPLITLVISAAMGLSAVLVVNLIRPVFRRAGSKSMKASSRMTEWVLQAVQGIKEIKASRKEAYFEEKYSEAGQEYTKTYEVFNALSYVPTHLIEAIMMSAIFLILAVLIGIGADVSAIIPSLAAIAFAAVRLLPAINRISVAAGDTAFREPRLDKLIETLSGMEPERGQAELDGGAPAAGLPGEAPQAAARFDAVTFRYGPERKAVLDGADLTIEKGQFVGVVGPSGAGKTTFADLLLGLLTPEQGRITVGGIDIRQDPDTWLARIGYIPQTTFLLNGSIRENVAFGVRAEEIDDRKVWDALEKAQLADFVREQPAGLDTETGERGIGLSGGQRQRIGIARALYTDPEILLFDEATSSLDTATEEEVMRSIRLFRGEKTVIVITHRTEVLKDFDVIYEVRDGKIRKQ